MVRTSTKLYTDFKNFDIYHRYLPLQRLYSMTSIYLFQGQIFQMLWNGERLLKTRHVAFIDFDICHRMAS